MINCVIPINEFILTCILENYDLSKQVFKKPRTANLVSVLDYNPH